MMAAAAERGAEEEIFGFEERGGYVHRGKADYEIIGFLMNPYGYEPESGNYIRIYVPRTETGVPPLDEANLPYGWSGMINEKTAETAVWWAFELLTEGEALRFMREHGPEVIFEYARDGRMNRLGTRHRRGMWIVEDTE